MKGLISQLSLNVIIHDLTDSDPAILGACVATVILLTFTIIIIIIIIIIVPLPTYIRSKFDKLSALASPHHAALVQDRVYVSVPPFPIESVRYNYDGCESL